MIAGRVTVVGRSSDFYQVLPFGARTERRLGEGGALLGGAARFVHFCSKNLDNLRPPMLVLDDPPAAKTDPHFAHRIRSNQHAQLLPGKSNARTTGK